MDYKKHYNLLIQKAIKRPIIKDYGEIHHIIPRCMGGSNEKDNLVKLTAREHFIAHLLLAKEYGGKLWAAVNRMLNSNVHNSRDYEFIRKQYSKSITGEGNPRFGVSLSKETKIKISLGNSGKVWSEDQKKTLRKSMKNYFKNNKRSRSNRLKTSKSKGGKPFKVYKAIVIGSNSRWQNVQVGEYIGTWQIARQCATDLGIDHQGIGKCLKGNRRHCKGYIFIYQDNAGVI